MEQLQELTNDICGAINAARPHRMGPGHIAAYLYEAGWRKQIEAEWIPIITWKPSWGIDIIHHYECSTCKALEYTNSKRYCPACGGKMKGIEES